MGTTNVKAGLEDRIAVFKGELEEVEAEIKRIEDGIEVLHKLKSRRIKLRSLIEGAEDIIYESDPEWRNKIKPRKKRKWHSPFKSGELGRRALEVLREKGRWMRPRDIAIIMLANKGYHSDDRVSIDKVTNSVGNYFIKHRNDLVESRGDYAKEWRIIPDSVESIKN
ncbi:MAG: hypothetical protein ACR2PC_03590 [Tsuneonella suprasediminis]|uniref:Uncharacterized protein n=1 Tax=Tsuneonella suprasediminis TaxID=2306996 RepID=A0A419R6C7_9SPHN|nr:hypothetical protein [Tsuneonella suprasediminis]RJX71318.1 hypothetical protein D6858_01530 [Tsuneonella suprasediminis]UBS31562.1 hypothetical protein LBX01_08525 [Altererythrobacter sp. N1]